MSTESGYQNQKKYGMAQFKTIQGVGSNKFGVNTAQMYLYDVTPAALLIVAAAADSIDPTKVYVEITAHGASVGDVLRILPPAPLAAWEFDIIEVLSANIIGVHNLSPTLPQAGNSVKICRWITAKADSEGALTTASGPIQFTRNGVTQTVVKDTVTPANTRGLPVEIVAANGTAINITAGDINVQTSHTGANPDSMRIGDGVEELAINADGSINIGGSALPTGAATSANQLIEQTRLGDVTEAAPGTDTASSGINGRLQRIAQRLTSLIALLPASLGQKTSANSLAVVVSSDQSAIPVSGPLTDAQLRATAVPISAAALPIPAGAATEAKQDAEAILIGGLTEAAPGTDTASSGLNGRLQRIAQRLTSLIALLPASLGQKTSANSLAVVMASDFVPAAPAVPAALTVKQAPVTFGTGASRLTTDAAAPSATRRKLQFIIEPPAGDVNYWIGSSSVNGTTQRGPRVYPGTLYTYDNDAGDYYIISDTAAQTVMVMEQE